MQFGHCSATSRFLPFFCIQPQYSAALYLLPYSLPLTFIPFSVLPSPFPLSSTAFLSPFIPSSYLMLFLIHLFLLAFHLPPCPMHATSLYPPLLSPSFRILPPPVSPLPLPAASYPINLSFNPSLQFTFFLMKPS